MMKGHYVLYTVSILSLNGVLSSSSKPLVLTPLLEARLFEQAQEEALITPDIDGVKSYSGFFNVDKKCGNHLFFWFFPAEISWEKAPVLLWLPTYPTRTVLKEVFGDVGPFNYTRKEGFIKREYSWTKKNNLIFLDQPVGNGFSFTERGCYPKQLSKIYKDASVAIIQFFQMFPSLRRNKFFIVGQNYAGRYAPGVAMEIDQHNNNSSEKINLTGIVIGDGYFDERCDNPAEFKYLLGMVDRKEKKRIDDIYNKFTKAVDAKDYAAVGKFKAENNIAPVPSDFNILYDKFLPDDFQGFIRKYQTRLQMHVGGAKFTYNNELLDKVLRPFVYEPVTSCVEKLLNTGKYIVGLYGGHLDAFNLYTSYQCVLQKIRWPGLQDYLAAIRRRWYLEDRLAGWVKVSGNVWEVVLRDSGLYCTRDQPKATYTLVHAAFVDNPGDKLLSRLNS